MVFLFKYIPFKGNLSVIFLPNSDIRAIFCQITLKQLYEALRDSITSISNNNFNLSNIQWIKRLHESEHSLASYWDAEDEKKELAKKNSDAIKYPKQGKQLLM